MSGSSTSSLQREKHLKRRASKVSIGVSNLLMIIFALYFMFPIVWLMCSTTKSTSELHNSGIFELGSSLVANVKWLNTYSGGIFWKWILNSLIISLVSASISVIVSSMGGYALTKYRFKLSGVISAVSFGSMMVPQAATVIPLFLMIKQFNLVNTYTGVILPMIASPFGLYFMTVYLKSSVPNELIDSGRVDGAGDMRIFWKIALPIMKPGLVTLFLIAFTTSWNNFFLPLVLLNKEAYYPSTVGLKLWVSNLRGQGVGEPMYPLVMLGAFISIFPMLLLFTFMRKYITSGITMGSVKT